MTQRKQAVLVTGVSGSLGSRLLPQLQAYDVVGVDVVPPSVSISRYAQVDLGRESSCRLLVELLRETKAVAVVHLAFIDNPARAGVSDTQRQWQTNVAGTARVMEAITEINRSGGKISKFIFTSSAQVYGPRLESPASESSLLAACSLTSAVHKKSADEVVQYRASSLGPCSSFILRAQNYAGPDADSFTLAALRGIPSGRAERACEWRKRNKRMRFFIPFGQHYLERELQFVHVDDMARLIAHILQRSGATTTTILNVSGRDGSLSFERCVKLCGTKLRRLPTVAACRAALRWYMNRGLSTIPPQAVPYLLGSNPVDTKRLREFLGSSYKEVIRHTAESALSDTLLTRGLGDDALHAVSLSVGS